MLMKSRSGTDFLVSTGNYAHACYILYIANFFTCKRLRHKLCNLLILVDWRHQWETVRWTCPIVVQWPLCREKKPPFQTTDYFISSCFYTNCVQHCCHDVNQKQESAINTRAVEYKLCQTGYHHTCEQHICYNLCMLLQSCYGELP